ncbi:cytochrome c oxidase assembly protein COX16-domain-containing protein [Peziza echinospora]|nr:cytochrome c oxidase assembly protein COX16-domain-containing protein [Peziza echinospora]
MGVFSRKTFRPTSALLSRSLPTRLAARYRRALPNHPFLLFGGPFIGIIVAGSFFLTPATALRYDKHDKKTRLMSKEEAMGLGKDRRKLDMNEEYYKLAAKDLDEWENKRVERLAGESDGVL